ncbi:MBL fold metallo-hydrolase [Thermoproteota archaeon]
MGNYRILVMGALVAAIVAVAIAIPLFDTSDDNRDTTQTSTNSSTTTTIINSTSTTTTTKIDDTQVLQQGNVTIYFIDVGQGDAIFVDTPDKDVLIDGGKSSQGNIVSDFLIDLGISELDYLIATHPDADHIGGLITVMERFNSLNYPIHKVLDNGQEKSTQTYQDYNQLAESIGIIVGERYQVFQLDLQTEMIIISPPNPQLFSDVNENSIVIMIRFDDVSFLLTGDMGESSENDLMESELNIDADILKVGHHGSRYSTTKDFLSAVSPEVAVISVGSNNRYEHPHTETLARLVDFGVEIYRTDQHSTISITTDGTNYSIISKPPQSTFDSVVINEVEANPEGTDSGNEWIELYNPTDKIIDVSGWMISTTHGDTYSYIIQEGTTIGSKSHIVITINKQFIDNTEESIILSNKFGEEIDKTPFLDDTENDYYTWQRKQDGSTEWIFKSSTKETSN